jgi:hypothetical protein
MKYELIADDIQVWKGTMRPTPSIINKAYESASNDGWNGVTLELLHGGKFIEEVGFTENTEAN